MKPLSTNSLFIGKVANYLTRVDSTNAFAASLLAKSTPIEGTVIYTDDQYAGRGQIGSKWESVVGKNIIMSVILQPQFLPLRYQFKLNQVVALAVHDLLSKYIIPPVHLAVKWPNDIYIKEKKIGGILIENKLRGTTLANSVVGIGLNINQNQFPSDLPNPTSLLLETGHEQDVYEMIGRLCECLEQRYLQLKGQHYAALDEAYLNALYRFQTWGDFEITATKQRIRGKIIGIASDGKLQIETSRKRFEFYFKEVAFL